MLQKSTKLAKFKNQLHIRIRNLLEENPTIRIVSLPRVKITFAYNIQVIQTTQGIITLRDVTSDTYIDLAIGEYSTVVIKDNKLTIS